MMLYTYTIYFWTVFKVDPYITSQMSQALNVSVEGNKGRVQNKQQWDLKESLGENFY